MIDRWPAPHRSLDALLVKRGRLPANAGSRGLPLGLAIAFTVIAMPCCSGMGDTTLHKAERLLSFTAVTARGNYACDATGLGAASARESIYGSVLRVSASALELDTCPPNADCRAARVPRLSFSAPGFSGLDRYLVPGAFVELEIETQRGASCRQRMLIRNVPVWKGAPDPGARALLIAAAHGLAESFEDAPFMVTAAPPSCGLRFKLTRRRGPLIERMVPPSGAAIQWPVSRGETWTVWNGSPSRSDACGESDGWSYWIASAPIAALP